MFPASRSVSGTASESKRGPSDCHLKNRKFEYKYTELQIELIKSRILPAHNLSLEACAGPLSVLFAAQRLHAGQFAALLPVQEHLVLDVVATLQHLVWRGRVKH